jgi:tRNA (guanine37-N1)-methyltransferase
MRIEIMTLFPSMCDAFLSESIIGRARAAGAVDIECYDIREYTQDKHKRVDDAPYGGGTGMIMQAQPINSCFEQICKDSGCRPHLIYMSPKGAVLDQNKVIKLSQLPDICILCGHYEGIDDRITQSIVDEEISIGDYVVTGGELPALILADAVSRMLPGVLRNEEAFSKESHFSGLLEYPQYTRPPVWNGMAVPEVLSSGDHRKIGKWQEEMSLKITKEKRPDLYIKYINNK